MVSQTFIRFGSYLSSLQSTSVSVISDIALADKQQEIDIPSLKVEDSEAHKKREKRAPMSQITGVRKLKHTNSFTGVVPKYGVEVANEEELSMVTFAYLVLVMFLILHFFTVKHVMIDIAVYDKSGQVGHRHLQDIRTHQ